MPRQGCFADVTAGRCHRLWPSRRRGHGHGGYDEEHDGRCRNTVQVLAAAHATTHRSRGPPACSWLPLGPIGGPCRSDAEARLLRRCHCRPMSPPLAIQAARAWTWRAWRRASRGTRCCSRRWLTTRRWQSSSTTRRPSRRRWQRRKLDTVLPAARLPCPDQDSHSALRTARPARASLNALVSGLGRALLPHVAHARGSAWAPSSHLAEHRRTAAPPHRRTAAPPHRRTVSASPPRPRCSS